MDTARDGSASAGSPTTYMFDASRLDHRVEPTQLSGGTKTGPTGAEFWLNSYYYTRDGKPWLPVMAEFHFARYPHAEWEQELLKIKAGGADIIATYVFWIHHEEEEGTWDWTGDNNLRKFIELCDQHGLQVWLRIGPWCHGECRNGGFPDWLGTKCKVRSNDPAYLAYVRKFFEQEFAQARGLLLKDGGPIIGVQLDNEYTAGPDHLMALRTLACEVGFDVPFYSATAWNGATLPEDEMIPMYGGYPDAPWTSGHDPLPPRGQYLYPSRLAGLEYDSGISSQAEGLDKGFWLVKGYPTSTCEVGAGNQITYRRRPRFSAEDIAVMAHTMLGKGINLLGYYMYHGGRNSMGRLTSMNEDVCPIISYDFEAPLGEFGLPQDWYHALRTLHLFTQDFGSVLAPAFPVLPPAQPADPADTDVLRCITRVDGHKGFVFFNNYQRSVRRKDLGPLQFEVRTKDETLIFPEKPITIGKDVYGIWPVNMDMDGVLLKYATAQPLCRVETPDGACYVFLTNKGEEPVFAFDPATSKSVKTSNGIIATRGGNVIVSEMQPGTDCTMSITSNGRTKSTVLVLTSEQALKCYKTRVWGSERLIITDCAVMCNGDQLELTKLGSERLAFSVFPDSPDGLSSDTGKVSRKSDGIMTLYEVDMPGKQITVEREVSSAALPKQAQLPDDRFDPGAVETITLPADAFTGVHDVFLKIKLAGDVLRLYQDDRLVGDDFYHGHDWLVGLNRFRPVDKLTLAVSPLKRDAEVYIPAEFMPEFDDDQVCRIKSIEAIPEYKAVIRLK